MSTPWRWRTAQLDPPWKEVGGGKSKRGADRHYKLMKVDDIAKAVLESGVWLPAPDAHLWCWYTDNYLLDALKLVDMLGFRYVRTFVWVKCKGKMKPLDLKTGLAVEGELELSMSLGQYGRGTHESMLFCVRGDGLSVRTDRLDIRSTFFAPVPAENGRRVHSRKPNAAYELIEARSQGPHAEFFARRLWPGWISWGDEIQKAKSPVV